MLGIKVLDLCNNQLEFIDPTVAKQSFAIQLGGNPLSLFPNQYWAVLWPVVKTWLLNVQERAENWRLCKVCIVGEDNVGKSFLKHLLEARSLGII